MTEIFINIIAETNACQKRTIRKEFNLVTFRGGEISIMTHNINNAHLNDLKKIKSIMAKFKIGWSYRVLSNLEL